jgi:hypothetical protein
MLLCQVRHSLPQLLALGTGLHAVSNTNKLLDERTSTSTSHSFQTRFHDFHAHLLQRGLALQLECAQRRAAALGRIIAGCR